MRDPSELNLNDGGEPVQTPPPAPQHVAHVEQLIGTLLPSSYIALLNVSNGGHPELDTIFVDVGDQTSSYAVNTFFHIVSDSHATTDTEDVVWNYHHRWPGAAPQLLPIANDGGGNLFCLDLTPQGHGRVVIQYHDEPGFPVVPISESVEQFIDALMVDPDAI